MRILDSRDKSFLAQVGLKVVVLYTLPKKFVNEFDLIIGKMFDLKNSERYAEKHQFNESEFLKLRSYNRISLSLLLVVFFDFSFLIYKYEKISQPICMIRFDYSRTQLIGGKAKPDSNLQTPFPISYCLDQILVVSYRTSEVY